MINYVCVALVSCGLGMAIAISCRDPIKPTAYTMKELSQNGNIIRFWKINSGTVGKLDTPMGIFEITEDDQ